MDIEKEAERLAAQMVAQEEVRRAIGDTLQVKEAQGPDWRSILLGAGVGGGLGGLTGWLSATDREKARKRALIGLLLGAGTGGGLGHLAGRAAAEPETPTIPEAVKAVTKPKGDTRRVTPKGVPGATETDYRTLSRDPILATLAVLGLVPEERIKKIIDKGGVRTTESARRLNIPASVGRAGGKGVGGAAGILRHWVPAKFKHEKAVAEAMGQQRAKLRTLKRLKKVTEKQRPGAQLPIPASLATLPSKAVRESVVAKGKPAVREAMQRAKGTAGLGGRIGGRVGRFGPLAVLLAAQGMDPIGAALGSKWGLRGHEPAELVSPSVPIR